MDIIERKMCSGCMSCKNICPKSAIYIEEVDGFDYPQIDEKKCINCGICRKICPVINRRHGPKIQKEVYACKSKDEELRMKSSSGGFFTILAERIIEEKGIVYAVKFDKDFNVIHDSAEKKEDLQKFRGSKYLQSRVGNVYINVKKELQKGRMVLFVGTPCQVEGLYAFLGKDYENLYTMDLICHGVPSREVWQKYLRYNEKNNKDKIQHIDFRNKENKGWSNYQLCFKYRNLKEMINHNQDPYMKLFLKNIDLRESCTNCSFKKKQRLSDITVGDFWGIDEVDKEFNDEKGVCAIILNSEKGTKIFEYLKDKFICKKEHIEDIYKYNPMIIESAKKDSRREVFFRDIKNKEFQYIIEKYL